MALFLALLGFLQLISSPADDKFLDKSKLQAKYYIKEINESSNLDESLWALSILGTGNPTIEHFIEKKVHESNYHNSPLSLFLNIEQHLDQQLKKVVFQTGSANLFISLLIETESKKRQKELYRQFTSAFSFPSGDIDYALLSRALISKETISSEILPNNVFRLPHFFILFKYKYAGLFSDKYLEDITNKWHLNASRFNFRLKTTLSKVSYFRVLYLLDQYSDINFLYPFLINNKLFPNSSIKLKIYQYLDYSMYRLGYYNRNLEIARNITLPLASYLKQEALKLRIKFATGINLYSIGKLEEAKKAYQEVLMEAKEKNIGLNLSSLYNNLALTYYKLGKYDEYLGLQFQALDAAQKTNNYAHQLEILNNLFIYYKRNNNEKNALFYLEEAQKIAQQKKPGEIGNIYISFGTVYRQFDSDYKKAHLYFNKAEEVLDPEDDRIYYFYLLNEQAKTYEQQEKFAKALEKYNRIITLTSSKKTPNYLDALVNKAQIYLRAGNMFQAEYFITKFKGYDLSRLDFEQLVKAKTVEAKYLYQNGHVEEALGILEPVLEQVVERARNSADLKTGYWHVADEYLNAFELAVSIHIGEGRPKKAVELLDRLKTINDASLYQSPLVRASMLNEKELTQYKRLLAQLDNARKNLLAAPKDERFEIQQTINRLKLKKGALDERLTDQADVSPISVDEVQSRLSAYELVLHITELKDKYYIARIFRSKVSLEIIPLDATLRNLFERSVRQIADGKTNLNSLYAITNVLDLRNIPRRIEKITVIPDSYLYQLPLPILPLSKPANGYSYGEADYLIEHYQTRYLTSLNDYKTIVGKPAGRDYKLNFVAFGVSNFENYTKRPMAPLPFAKAEVHAIADRLTNLQDKRVFINNESTKEAFKHTAPDARILHLATHSKVSERDPLFSAFYMSKPPTHPDSAFQDQIFAYELFELKLNNEMIMLNSCESGSGSYLQGTGVMGISRALQYAGANSLVLNLWPVNDMLAADFAVYFYDQLNHGKSKAEAMRATKLYFLENKNASPHFWGPYLLIGNAQPIVQPNQSVNLMIAGGFSLYFLLLVGLSIFKKLKVNKV